jgi:hypothetical protein
VLRAAVLLAVLGPVPALSAADKDKDKPKTSGKVSGIVFDKGERWMKVKADGDKEPIKYVWGSDADKKLLKTLQGIFSVSRVQLTWKLNGDERQIVGIRKTTRMVRSTVTGVVLGTHGWWVEIKPKNGVPDGYAATYPKEKWEATQKQLKELEKGDVVTISYYTDFERHRIESLRTVRKAKK